jgi:hypothetical protein
MKNDYLWDPSGEPDNEIERIESQLKQFRYQPGTLELEGLEFGVKSGWGIRNWIAVAASVAAIALLAVGAWVGLRHRGGSPSDPLAQSTGKASPYQAVIPESATGNPSPAPSVNPSLDPSLTPSLNSTLGPLGPLQKGPLKVAPLKQPGIVSGVVRGSDKQPDRSGTPRVGPRNAAAFAVAATAIRPNSPLMDAETSRHIEEAQRLLIAFKNNPTEADDNANDVAYYRQRCRLILSSNVLLRRSAESTGNVPMEELLGSLEPFLLDIANLPEKPSQQDLGSIRDRIDNNEILVALEAYTPGMPDRTF